MKTKIQTYSTNLDLYFKLKNRTNIKMKSKEYKTIIKIFATKLKNNSIGYDIVVIPYSSQTFLEDVVKESGVNYIIINKNNKNTILPFIRVSKCNNQVKESQINRINNMEDKFRIKKIKLNQRHLYIPILFKDMKLENKKVLIVDDSIFSGNTIKAIQNKVNSNNVICFFRGLPLTESESI